MISGNVLGNSQHRISIGSQNNIGGTLTGETGPHCDIRPQPMKILPYGDIPDKSFRKLGIDGSCTPYPINRFLKTLKPLLRPSKVFREQRNVETIDRCVTLGQTVETNKTRLHGECDHKEGK